VRPTDCYAHIVDKDAIIQKHEKQNKDFIEEISQLQDQISSSKKALESLEERNSQLVEKVSKLEAELLEQKERELKLKALHNDEMKHNVDMNTYEQQLFQSKIKELESNLASMQNQIQLWNVADASACSESQACVCQDSQVGDDKSQGRLMLNHSARLDSLQQCLLKKSRYNDQGACGLLESSTATKAP